MSQSYMDKNFGDCKEIMLNALQAVGDPLICIDLNFLVTFINSAAENLLEYGIDEIVGNNIDKYLNIVDGVTNEKKKNLIDEILKSKTNLKLSDNIILISKTGKRYNILFSGTPIKTKAGDLLGLMLSFRDISFEQTAKLKLLESEKRFNNIFEASADAIYVLKNGVIDACNLACLELLKYKNESELIGKNPDIIFAEYQNGDIKSSDQIKIVLENLDKKGSHRFDWIHNCADNSKIECEVVLTKLEYEGDNFVLAVLRDITEQKQSYQKIIESEEKFRNLHETMNQAVMYFDENFKLVSANRAIKQIFEIENENKAPDMKKYIFTDLDGNILKFEDQPLYKALKFGQKVIDFKYGIFNPETLTQKWVNSSAYPLNSVDGNENGVAYIILSDITELIETSKALQLEKEKAENNDSHKTAFLANVSHEIRTPMNAIVGFSQFLQADKISKKDLVHYTEIISNSAQNLLRIIDDLLDISKIEEGKLMLQYSVVNITKLLEETYLIFYENIKKKKLDKIELVYHKLDEDIIVKADETRLQQILNNLIGNAIKFTPEGKVEFGLKIKQNILQFYVKDTGIGIPTQVQSKVFERFWQNYTVSDKFPKGTGLGLSLSKKLAILMKGDISFTSEENKGSEFVLQIPYIIADASVPQKNDWTSKISSSKKLKILVVEDDAINTLYLQELLKRYENFDADYVGDGYAALEMLETKKYDLILLDIQLPNIDGYEVARQVRKFDENIKIIAQTAYAMPEDHKKCLLAGCNDYTSKPINVNELVALLNKYSEQIN